MLNYLITLLKQIKYMTKSQSRFLSLDVLRGLTIIGMILVNSMGIGNPPQQLMHCPWNGCRVADLIYPFFLFIVGAAIYFAFRKTQWQMTWPLAAKIVRRGVLLALIGFLLNIYPFTREPSTWRFFGVMQRIGFVYVATCFIVFGLRKTRWILLLSAVILAGYGILMYCCGLDLGDNAVLSVDRWMVGDSHLFKGYGIPFDPEGTLSSIPAVVNGLLGFVCALAMSNCRRKGRPFAWTVLVFGIGLLALGWASSYWVPFNKPLWSSSFVLWSCGWAAVIWVVLSWITDTHSSTRWATPALVFGSNALFTYIVSELILISDWTFRFDYEGYSMSFSHWIDFTLTHSLPEPLRSLAWGIMVLTFCGLVAWPLYRRRIFIKL